MFDNRMVGIPNQIAKGMVEIELPLGWIAHNHPAFRVADIGAPVLTYVAILSAAEAADLNDGYKQCVQERLKKGTADIGVGYPSQQSDEIDLAGANQVDALLETIKQEGYFASWVLIESCTID